jgi:hypothetical protein
MPAVLDKPRGVLQKSVVPWELLIDSSVTKT